MPVQRWAAWLRNGLGGTHVSSTWRPYSRRSCCQDRRWSILRSRLTRGVIYIPRESWVKDWIQIRVGYVWTGKFDFNTDTCMWTWTSLNPERKISTEILGWIWDSGTLQASPHRVAALASSSKPETPKVLFGCLLSPDSRYTPVLRLTVTCRHCRRRSPVSRED